MSDLISGQPASLQQSMDHSAFYVCVCVCVCVCVRSIPGYRRLSPTLLQGLGSGERTEKRNEQLLTTTCKSISASGRKRGNRERKQGWGERCGGSEQQRDEKLVTSSDRVRNWVGGGNVAWHYK